MTEPANSSPAASPASTQPSVSSSLFARLALGLSIFAFLVPLGIAAIVLGHMEARHDKSGTGAALGNGMARAALWIAYLQLALLSVAVMLGWGFFYDTTKEFQRDALVQRFFRESDKMNTLDPESAWDAESTAQDIVYQFIAINEQVRRHSEDGDYACTISQLAQVGLEGTSEAEKRAFSNRVQLSPYIYAISACDPSIHGMTTAAYSLTAVPISPRMPDNSAIFCTDQTGTVRTISGGISIDCFKNGQPVR